METSSEVYFKASRKNLNMRTVRRLKSLSDLTKASSANVPQHAVDVLPCYRQNIIVRAVPTYGCYYLHNIRFNYNRKLMEITNSRHFISSKVMN